MADIKGCNGNCTGICARCKYRRLCSRLKSPPWLADRLWTDKTGHLRWGFGCQLCSRTFRATKAAPWKVLPYAHMTLTTSSKYKLQRHESCAYHQKGALTKLAALAPPVEDFLKVLRHVTKHGAAAGKSGIPDLGGREKSER